MLHGTGLYTYIWPKCVVEVDLVNIPVPWSIWEKTFPVFHPTIIRKTRQPPHTIHGRGLQILQRHLSFRSGCQLILIAYIHNGGCCYEL